ncbi:MAG TPA: filamentous hemagglutinin N-terminal domain-containing protein, partial [Caulobacteraceae bacterium]|nr:filamentous hemagglutinin N-terminal domain-containing protein [Caulobacteraceae bacterium]
MNTPLKLRCPKALMLSGASAVALMLAHPAAAQTLSGLRGAMGLPGTRGANTGAAATSAAALPGSAVTPAQAAQRTTQSTADLNNAVAALKAQLTTQANAQAAAKASVNSSTPNGLVAGGLVIAAGVASDPSLWQNANAPIQTTSNGQTTVTIDQTAQKAILSWSSFNVGKATTLYFDQAAGTQSSGTNSWVVLNRIDASGAPSQILGQIKAEGAVYLLNQNGIIFGGSSQVNVNSLVASSLCLFTCNTSESNSRFLNGGIGDLSPTNGTSSVSSDGLAHSILFTPPTDSTGASTAGDITIEAGGTITSGAQSLVLIAAPNVTNHGQIITGQGGQVALIAGIGVSYDYNLSSFTPFNAAPQFTEENSTTFLRFANYGQLLDGSGNDITPLGTLTNDGVIYAPTGDITGLGANIVQGGVMAATTSVSRPGSIVLTAAYEVGAGSSRAKTPSYEASDYFPTGSISFGKGSVTTILPDTGGLTIDNVPSSLAVFDVSSNPAPAIFTTPLPTSGLGLISVIGQAIDVQGGSLLYAPGQNIGLATSTTVDPRFGAVAGSGRIYVEDGATVDVSGIADVQEQVSENLLTLALTLADLADSPLQKDGFLYGATVTVDLGVGGTNANGEGWIGTPLANLTSYKNLIPLSISQVLSSGGAVTLYGSEVVVGSGSTIDLMGGYTHYLGGVVDTTRLVDATSGHMVDIANANPNDTYSGIAGVTSVDHTRWGVTDTYDNPLFTGGTYVADYVTGGAGGYLVINTGAAVMQGTVLASAVSGVSQVASGAQAPGGVLSLTSGSYGFELGTAQTLSSQAQAAMTTPAGFTMASEPLSSTPGYTNIVLNSDQLTGANYSNVTLTGVGAVLLDAGATLAVQNGGSIALGGLSADIEGALVARAGKIGVEVGGLAQPSFANVPEGDLVIGAKGLLDVSGLFVNDTGTSQDTEQGPANIDGGAISLTTNTDVAVVYDPTHTVILSSNDYTSNLLIKDGAR